MSVGIEVETYTGETLTLTVTTTDPGYLSFIDNWDPDWEVLINDQEAEILLLFNTFKSIYLPPGINDIIFQYHPQILN